MAAELANPILYGPYDPPERYFEVGPSGLTGDVLDTTRLHGQLGVPEPLDRRELASEIPTVETSVERGSLREQQVAAVTLGQKVYVGEVARLGPIKRRKQLAPSEFFRCEGRSDDADDSWLLRKEVKVARRSRGQAVQVARPRRRAEILH